MRLKHNVPPAAFRVDPITPEYQAEVDRATAKAVVDYERAQRRLRAAEERLERARERSARQTINAKRSRAIARELAVAAELVELRREELQRLEDMMRAAPASAEHRGVKSYSPVPRPGRQV